MGKQRKEPEKVTIEHIQEFWNHNINPITGLKVFKNELTISEKEENRFRRTMRDKFNKE